MLKELEYLKFWGIGNYFIILCNLFIFRIRLGLELICYMEFFRVFFVLDFIFKSFKSFGSRRGFENKRWVFGRFSISSWGMYVKFKGEVVSLESIVVLFFVVNFLLLFFIDLD